MAFRFPNVYDAYYMQSHAKRNIPLIDENQIIEKAITENKVFPLTTVLREKKQAFDLGKIANADYTIETSQIDDENKGYFYGGSTQNELVEVLNTKMNMPRFPLDAFPGSKTNQKVNQSNISKIYNDPKVKMQFHDDEKKNIITFGSRQKGDKIVEINKDIIFGLPKN